MSLVENYAAVDLEEGLQLTPQFEKRGGLLPVAVQETDTGQLLMLASINEEALQQTMQTGLATFWSTSRNQLWVKGETSGDFLKIDNILVDCDQDAFVYQVTLQGEGVCHTYDKHGKHRKACFYRKVDTENNRTIPRRTVPRRTAFRKLQFIKNLH
ncbi:MAG: phosphoribosyl-AMP cyclohydrolase [Bacteroidota bacterium]